MKIQFLTLALSAALTIATVGTPIVYSTDAEARSYSRSSSFSRSSFRSSSSSRSSKSASRPSNTGSFWSSKGSKVKKQQSIKTKQRTATIGGNKSVRTKDAVNISRQQSKFKKAAYTPPSLKTSGGKRPSRVAANNAYRDTYKQNPVYNRARTSNPATYYDRRNKYYGASYEPPMYVYNSSPSFGMWDTIFLYSILNNNNASQFAHNHQNDADYRRWREEAEREAKTNADLRAQLAAMDAGAAKLAGTPINSDYLPAGVDADIALAQDARLSALPDMKVCTGGVKGAYFTVTAGVMAPNAEYVNIIPVPTAGTGQALEYLTAGKCDAAWAQANGYWNYIEKNETANLPFSRVFSPYREGIHVMCHEDGPSKISQLDEDNTLLFPRGSGAEETMRDWIAEDEDYAEVKTVINTPSLKVKSNQDAALMVSQDRTKKSCMMYVAAPGATEFMKEMNASAKALKLVLIDVNDSDFNDTTDPSGNDVYETMEFDQELYGNLTRNAGALWGGGDIHTLDVAADFLISDAWKGNNSSIYSKMVLKIAGMEDRIKTVLRPTNR